LSCYGAPTSLKKERKKRRSSMVRMWGGRELEAIIAACREEGRILLSREKRKRRIIASGGTCGWIRSENCLSSKFVEGKRKRGGSSGPRSWGRTRARAHRFTMRIMEKVSFCTRRKKKEGGNAISSNCHNKIRRKSGKKGDLIIFYH